ncbi:hypothetical protein MKW94_026605 [Papaver nudicaule]|uniref:Thioredoxin domain-containing protein n=1 Tax=Papaver nudicaule TaxID=74823 RepID=A0AA41RUB1_PAPNU|nr:hypothetical protein [Papaver nudicaule]
MAATATIKSFLLSSTKKLDPSPANTLFLSLTNNNNTPYMSQEDITKAIVAKEGKSTNERVQQVHSIEEFDVALQTAKNKLVVVSFAATHSRHSRKIYPLMVDLSRSCYGGNVQFVLVMGDESDETKALCEREEIGKIPHFIFYKSMEKIHEEEGMISPDELMRDVLYYGDKHSAVIQLQSKKDVNNLIEEHRNDNKLIVYPTVLMLSRQMVDTVVFARMNGDENDSCVQFLEEMDIVEVPTFLFVRDGVLCGRYVGSGKVKFMGELLKHQGVKS